MSRRVVTMKVSALRLHHCRALALLGMGYDLPEIQRRIQFNRQSLSTLARRLTLGGDVCAPEQLDGRKPVDIVRVWATLNLGQLNERIRVLSTPLPKTNPVVTEARLGVA